MFELIDLSLEFPCLILELFDTRVPPTDDYPGDHDDESCEEDDSPVEHLVDKIILYYDISLEFHGNSLSTFTRVFECDFCLDVSCGDTDLELLPRVEGSGILS